jgi:hypothetical protein
MRNLIGVADGVKLSESAPFGIALGLLTLFSADFLSALHLSFSLPLSMRARVITFVAKEIPLA